MAHSTLHHLTRNKLVQPILFALGTCTLLLLAFQYATTNLLAVQLSDPDEGVYLGVARLLNYGHGYSEFFYDQFWLFPQILAFMMRVAGDSLQTGRLTIVLFSMLGLLGMVLLARQLGAGWLALLAIPFGILNRYYLLESRITMADVPSVSLLIWALFAAFAFSQSNKRVWLLVSAVCCSAGLVIKPLGVAFVVPVVYAVLAARIKRVQGHWQINPGALLVDGILFITFALLTAAPFVNLLDLRGEYQRTVGFHLAESAWYAPSTQMHLEGILGFLAEDRMWFGLAFVGLVLSINSRKGMVITLVAAELLSAYLLFLLPPWENHYTLLAPLLTTFAAVGVAGGARTFLSFLRQEWRAAHASTGETAVTTSTHQLRALSFVLVVTVLWVLGAVLWFHDMPELARYNRNILDHRAPDVTKVVKYLDTQMAPGDFVLSDNPIIVYLAKCLIPPSAVNLPYASTFRFSPISNAKLAQSITQYPVKAVIVTDGYKSNRRLMGWIESNFPTVNNVGGGRSNLMSASIYRPVEPVTKVMPVAN